MKLALMALSVEIGLARLFTNSWGWAVAVVALYCTFVYVRQTIAMKKTNRNEPELKHRNTMIQANMRRNSKKQNLYNTPYAG